MSSERAFRIFSLSVALALLAAAFSAHDETIAQTRQPEPRGNVLNPYGAPVGAVDEQGTVTTPYGSKLGDVDAGGRVYNVSGIFIGRVYPNGDIFNQAGDYLGSVDAEGNVYNVSDFKVGSVRAGGNVFLAGGAARIIFFKASRGVAKRPVPVPRPR